MGKEASRAGKGFLTTMKMGFERREWGYWANTRVGLAGKEAKDATGRERDFPCGRIAAVEAAGRGIKVRA